MMETSTFQALDKEIRERYAAGKYASVIELIDQAMPVFPDQRLYFTYWQMGMAARLENHKLVYHFMDELLLDDLWVNPEIIRSSPSFETIAPLYEFEGRLEKFSQLQVKEFAALLPVMLMRQEGVGNDPKKPAPLLLGLHPDRTTSLQTARLWEPAAHRGWLAAALQSSQSLWSGAYVWDNREIAQMEIEHHLGKINEKYAIDQRRVLIAGLEMGGELAMWLGATSGVVLRSEAGVRGFLAIDPAGPMTSDHQQWMRQLQAVPPRGLRGAIMVSDKNPAGDELLKLGEIMTLFEVPVRVFFYSGRTALENPSYRDSFNKAMDYAMD